jgi:hypothetical protein
MSCEQGIVTKEFLTISLNTIHWLQRSCERGITTKEFLTISLNTVQVFSEIVRNSLVVIPHSQVL